MFLEAHHKWTGATKILGLLRKSVRIVDSDLMRKGISDANLECEEETGSPMSCISSCPVQRSYSPRCCVPP